MNRLGVCLLRAPGACSGAASPSSPNRAVVMFGLGRTAGWHLNVLAGELVEALPPIAVAVPDGPD
jgi:hypothetical protein